ncbi:MAG: DoxX family protein [Sphingomonadaceae bacterium]
MLRDLGMLILRLTIGTLLMGHGSQKLFGWFGGYGLRGTAVWLEGLGFRPGHRWAPVVGLAEFGGGLLTALGLVHPVGPIVTMAPMSVAIGTAHWGKPIWATAGGGELPATNIAIATALTLAGPGRFSLDRVLGIRLPGPIAALVAAATAIGVVVALTSRAVPSQRPEAEAGTRVEAGQEVEVLGTA